MKKKTEQAKTPEAQDPLDKLSLQQQAELRAGIKRLIAVKGIGDPALSMLVIAQVEKMMFNYFSNDLFMGGQAILALLQGMETETTTQLLLAVQMLGVHSGAIFHMCRANETVGEVSDRHLLKATSLMKLFAEQADVMTRLKGKAAQKVVVEHHHVEDKPLSFNPRVAMPGGQENTGTDNVSEDQPVGDGRFTRKKQAKRAKAAKESASPELRRRWLKNGNVPGHAERPAPTA